MKPVQAAVERVEEDGLLESRRGDLDDVLQASVEGNGKPIEPGLGVVGDADRRAHTGQSTDQSAMESTDVDSVP